MGKLYSTQEHEIRNKLSLYKTFTQQMMPES